MIPSQEDAGTIHQPQCGDWGMLTADVNPPSNCYVDMADFMTLTTGWMDCTNPQPPCLYKPTQPF